MKHIRRDGNVKWTTTSGRSHKVEGPAVIHPDGQSSWYVNGRLYRNVEMGAAGLRPNGKTLWTHETSFENGNIYRKNVWREL